MRTPDRRTVPANKRVAGTGLAAEAGSRRAVEGEWMRCRSPSAPLLAAPDGRMDSQLLFGERFLVLELRAGWAFGLMERDEYVGYLESCHLAADDSATHRVRTLWTHLYEEADIKSVPATPIPFGSRIQAVKAAGDFLQLADGKHVLSTHLDQVGVGIRDYVCAAELFLGSPYLWGGCTPAGIDCSGLVQLSLIASGASCPRDSDMQEGLGGGRVERLDDLKRGDLVFWSGHVGIMVSPNCLLHATAHHMAVVREPLHEVLTRIQMQESATFRGFWRPMIAAT